ncbi:hypothetical protein VA596_42435 [Amycolatopsis sp., V23-08]|uniref:Restriction endonuclease n=1 Tax=Amycolatopsis heterodermiae TaxID=3110235 RepID=A0ABU5RL13_9PSEU|nr:hypothetical protein [Amycolatopsis sp., V23-08]MEA5366249.1 hypothetical protein [Amycolatopsis sp., V23-08]
MTIFSALGRTDSSSRAHAESHFGFLDRVAGHYWDQVRGLIEDWFSRLCPDAQADVRGRLRSRDDRQCNGAFFELYLHECLLRMGYAVTCHPEIEGSSRRPDFLAEKDGAAVYVEARSASSSDVVVGAVARVNTLYESLDKIDSPNFFLSIDVEKQGGGPLRARPLRSKLENWLRELDPDAYTDRGNGRHDFPDLSYAADGWRIQFHALPKSPEARGKEGVKPLGIFGGGQDFPVHDEEGVRSALSDKGSAYGPLGAPYIVAVASSSIINDDFDVKNALYGTEALLIGTGPGGDTNPAVVRDPNGYWYKGDHWGHRHVSAVLVVKQLHPAFVGTKQHTVWEHPDPEWSVPPLPMWRRSTVDPHGVIHFADPARAPTEWFGLTDPWPIGEPFSTPSHS